MKVYPINYKKYAPLLEPVSLEEVKQHLRITDTSEDTLIESLISVAREWCETYENRVYTETLIEAHYNNISHEMVLPINPVISIDKIEYKNSLGIYELVSEGDYEIDSYSFVAYIYFVNPSYAIASNVINPVRVTYKAGYLDDPSSGEVLPARVKHSIKLIVAHLFEHREQVSETSLNTIPFSAKNLLTERVF